MAKTTLSVREKLELYELIFAYEQQLNIDFERLNNSLREHNLNSESWQMDYYTNKFHLIKKYKTLLFPDHQK